MCSLLLGSIYLPSTQWSRWLSVIRFFECTTSLSKIPHTESPESPYKLFVAWNSLSQSSQTRLQQFDLQSCYDFRLESTFLLL